MTISLCITTFNRLQFTLNSFQKVYDDPRISEIVIVDDCSDKSVFDELVRAVEGLSKVRLIRNASNQGCYFNKYIAISYAKNDYCIILDSDNQIDAEYVDAIYRYDWDPKFIFAPDYAMPAFDYRPFGGALLSRKTVAYYSGFSGFDCLINTMNYFVNRDEFVRVFDQNVKHYSSDSMYINLKWLEAGNKIFVVEQMPYYHAVHDGSHFQQFQQESQKDVDMILNTFKTMT